MPALFFGMDQLCWFRAEHRKSPKKTLPRTESMMSRPTGMAHVGSAVALSTYAANAGGLLADVSRACMYRSLRVFHRSKLEKQIVCGKASRKALCCTRANAAGFGSDLM